MRLFLRFVVTFVVMAFVVLSTMVIFGPVGQPEIVFASVVVAIVSALVTWLSDHKKKVSNS